MDEEVQKSIEDSLRPLYFLTQSFLSIIKPNYEDVELLIRKLKQNFNDDGFSDYSVLFSDWKLWLKHYLAITLIILLGISIGISLLLVALCGFVKVFCCRCGAKRSGKLMGGRKVQACRKGFCSAILITVSTIILACSICSLVTNELLYEQTSIPPRILNMSLQRQQYLFPTVSKSINTLKDFKENTIEELQSQVYMNLKQKVVHVVEHIKDIPVDFANKFLATSGMTHALDLSNNFLIVVNNVTEILQRLQDGKHRLIDAQQTLKRNLSEIKRDLLSNVPRQCRATCLKTRESINNIKITVDYNEIKDFTNVLKWMRVSINDLQDSISKAKEFYSSIVDKLKESTEAISKDVKKKVDNLLIVVDRQFAKVLNIFDEIKVDDYYYYFNEHVIPEMSKYGKWRYGICMCIGIVILLWVVFAYLGICCMTCSDFTCRRRKANRMLQISLTLVLIFAWCFTFVGIILFIVGSIIYFETCTAILYKQNTTFVKLADITINDWLNQTHEDVSLLEILKKCENNEAIYSILKLEQKMNVSQAILTNMENLKKYIDKSKIKVNFDFQDFKILNQDIETDISRMSYFEDHLENFIKFEEILLKEITNPKVENIIEEINSYSDIEAYDMKSYTRLQKLNTIILSMDAIRDQMKQHLEFIKTEINKKARGEGVVNKTTDILNVLKRTQEFVRNNGVTEIKKLLEAYSESIVSDMDEYLSNLNLKIQEDILQCRPLYDIIISSTQVVCETVLDPFNGFWLSVLLSVLLSFFMIISIRCIQMSKYSIEDQLPSFDTDDPRCQPLIKNVY